MLNFILSLVLAYGPDIVAAIVGLVLSLIMIKRRGSLYALFGFLAMLVAVGLGTVDLVYLTWFASHTAGTALMVSRVLTGAADVVALASWALILVALFIKPKPEPAKSTAASGGTAAQAGWSSQSATGPALGGQPPSASVPPQPGFAQPGTGQPGTGQPGTGQPGVARPVSGQPAAQPAPGFGQPVPGQPQPGSAPQPGFGQPQPGAGTPQWGQPGGGPSPY